MTPQQLDALLEQLKCTSIERDIARIHVVNLQDEMEFLKSQIVKLTNQIASNDTTTQFSS